MSDSDKGANVDLRAQAEWIAYILAAIDVHETTYKKKFWPDGMSETEKTGLLKRVSLSLMKDAYGGRVDRFQKLKVGK